MKTLRLSYLPLHLPLFFATSFALAAACSNNSEVDSSDPDRGNGGTGFGSDEDSLDGSMGLGGGGGGAVGAGGKGGTTVDVIETLPEGFTASGTYEGEEPAFGGYKRQGKLEDLDSLEANPCSNILRAVTRDFADAHVDFGLEQPDGPNFVLADLGDDRKPVLNPARAEFSKIEAFDDWYNNVEANEPYVTDLWLEPVEDTFVFSSSLYFPLDGVGDPDEREKAQDGELHNFLFTTELHTKFRFKGDETFSFRGDDDVWVFINGKLAVDLGGVHGPQPGSVDLGEDAEELGLTEGEVYTLDLFHAERRPFGSNFRIETTLDFTGCGEVLPDDVIK